MILFQVEVEFANTCQWEWFRCPLDLPHSDPTPDPTHLEKLSISHTYWPSDVDSGRKLLLKCIPVSTDGKEGESKTVLSDVVSESPKVTPITKRHLLTPARLSQPDVFRMVTYNTLAGIFTADSYARNILYPYCEPAALDIEYRQGRIVSELLGYNADVLCLQEVGTDTFRGHFLPALHSKGYEGCHAQKSGSVSDHAFPCNAPLCIAVADT